MPQSLGLTIGFKTLLLLMMLTPRKMGYALSRRVDDDGQYGDRGSSSRSAFVSAFSYYWELLFVLLSFATCAVSHPIALAPWQHNWWTKVSTSVYNGSAWRAQFISF